MSSPEDLSDGILDEDHTGASVQKDDPEEKGDLFGDDEDEHSRPAVYDAQSTSRSLC